MNFFDGAETGRALAVAQIENEIRVLKHRAPENRRRHTRRGEKFFDFILEVCEGVGHQGSL
jgi:hypothetical protein